MLAIRTVLPILRDNFVTCSIIPSANRFKCDKQAAVREEVGDVDVYVMYVH